MLIGKTVRLRSLEPGDVDRAYTWINDREVTRFLETRYPLSRAAEEQWLARATLMNGFPDLALAIETLADGRHIGGIDLRQGRPEDRTTTLGIMIGDKDFWSRGYGTDAVVTLLRFAFEEMNLNRVMLHVHEDNARAVACYRKCGFVEEGRLRQDRYKAGRYWDTLVMGVLREEFRAIHGGPEAPK